MLYTNTFEIEKGCMENAGYASSAIKRELKKRILIGILEKIEKRR